MGGASSDVGGTIISVLEVAESDFTKLLAEADTDEQAAASAFTLREESNLKLRTARVVAYVRVCVFACLCMILFAHVCARVLVCTWE